MSYSDYKKRLSSFLYSEERFTDDKLISNSSRVPPLSPQVIVFPYVGPPGSGPGLLGNRPGCGGTEYLAALERHASSLKSALQVVASLRNSSEDCSSSDFDSAEDKESESKKTSIQNEGTDIGELGLFICNSSAKGPQINSLSDTDVSIGLNGMSSLEHSSNASSPCDSMKSEAKQCTKCKFLKCAYRASMNISDDKSQNEDSRQTDHADEEGSKFFSSSSSERCIPNGASQHLVICSSYEAGDNQSISDAMFRNDIQCDIEDSMAILKKKALRTTRNALREFQRLMREKETSPHHKIIEGVLICLTSICKEEKLWRIRDDLLVSLEFPL